MFTGIVEQVGTVIANHTQSSGKRLIIEANLTATALGESIAVNGVCLTLCSKQGASYEFDVSPETLSCTTLGALKKDNLVNLEQAMSANHRFGGHYVSGHVDTTAIIQSITTVDDFVNVRLGGFGQSDLKYLLHKGSIAMDGISLTINSIQDNLVHLLLVPHTIAATNFKRRSKGDHVNVEYDHLAKMVAHQVELTINSSR